MAALGVQRWRLTISQLVHQLMARVMVGLPGAIGHNNNVAMYCVVLCCAVLCYAVRVQYGRDDRLGSERRLCLLGKRLGCGYTCSW